MVKSYLRYESSDSWGVVCSGDIIYDQADGTLVAASLEALQVWNVKLGSQDRENEAEATKLVSLNSSFLCSGHTDGSVRIWNITSRSLATVLRGHRGAITSLAAGSAGSILASGGSDTNIVVWDAVAERGICRLKGHRGAITDLRVWQPSDGTGVRVISSSKDTLIKLWDVDGQHCIQTLVGHRSEVWCLALNPDCTRLIAGSGDQQLRVWSLAQDEWSDLPEESSDNSTQDKETVAKFIGLFSRQRTDRVAGLCFSNDGSVLACHGTDNTVEMWEVLSADRIASKRKRKAKKRKAEATESNGDLQISPGDELKVKEVIRAGSKIRSISLASNGGSVAIALANNQLEIWQTPLGTSPELMHAIEQGGHRADVRDIALSHDDTLLMSATNGWVKVWNLKSKACIRTVPTGYVLCCAFLPGNRHAVVGTKTGKLELLDLASGEAVQSEEAHEACIWSLDMTPDRAGLVTGSADKLVKFWSIEIGKSGQPTLKHTRTLRMSEEVLYVRFTSDGKLLAVALMDATVKVFFEDSLRFFLALYGHKLPVMSLDMSTDGQLIATGSADKNLRIWGLDFGDCHKSIFAHDDSVMTVRFVPRTHYIWTAGKDKLLKCWDGDTFEPIQTLRGHHGAVWSENSHSQCFELLGFDVLVDSDLKPWLLEVNQSPSLGTPTQTDKDVKRTVLEDTFTLLGLGTRPADMPVRRGFWRVYPSTAKAELYAPLFCFPFPQQLFDSGEQYLTPEQQDQVT